MTRCPPWWAALLAVAVLAVATDARAQSALDAARTAYERGALAEALDRFQAALAEPGNTREVLVEIHLRLGVIRAALGEEEAARRAFDRALALAPDLETPSELPPEHAAWLDEVRASRAEPLRLVVEVRDRELLSAHVEHAPEGVIDRLRFEMGSGWSREIEGTSAELALDEAMFGESSARTFAVSALDTHGGVWAHATAEVLPPRVSLDVRAVPPAAPPIEPAAPAREEDLLESPWLWLGVGAAALVVAAIAIAVGIALSEHPGFAGPSGPGD